MIRADRLRSLASPVFIAALALLVINDFALKPLLHNAITGKLSDFAGLFALTLFLSALWPKHRSLAACVIAVSFTFWKTNYAEPLIAAWNAVAPFAVERTVDLSDLVALPMIPLAVWSAPRLRPWPFPRALQLGLAVLAPLAFAATTQPRGIVRSTLDVSSAAVVDENALRAYFDQVAGEHGLRCTLCDSLDEGRVYSGSRPSAPDELTVNFDSERRHVFYSTTAYGRRAQAKVRSLSEDVRTGMQELFPGVTVVELATDFASLLDISTLFTIQLSTENGLSAESAEQAKRTFSSIVEDIVRTNGLRADETQLVYYAGRRFGGSAYERELILAPVTLSNTMMRIRVARQTSNYAAQYETIKRELAARLDAAFGFAAVTREEYEAD